MAARRKRDWRVAAGRLLVALALVGAGAGRAGGGPARERGLPVRRHHPRRRRALPQGRRPLAADPRAQRHRLAGRAQARRRAPDPGRRRWPPPTRRSPSRSPRSRRRPPRARASSPRSRSAQAIENRDTAVEQRDLGAWAEVVSYAGLATEFADKALAISVAQRDRAAEAVVSDAQGDVEGRAPDQPRWSPRDGRGRAGRVRAAAHPLRLDGAGDLPRPEPPPAQPQLQRHHPADAQRPADRRRGHQGQPGQRRLLRAPEPARRPHRLRGGGARRRDRDPVRRLLGQARRRGLALHQLRRPRPRDHPRRRDDLDRRERGRGAAQRRRDRAHPTCWRAPSSPPPSTGRSSSTPPSPSPGSRRRGPRATGWRWRPTPTSTSCRPPSGGCATPAAASTASGRATTTGASPRSTGSACPGVRSLSWRFRIVDDETPPFVTLAAPKEAEVVTTAEVAVGRRGRARRAR